MQPIYRFDAVMDLIWKGYRTKGNVSMFKRERERERETAAAVAAGGALRFGDLGADSVYAVLFDEAGRKKRQHI